MSTRFVFLRWRPHDKWYPAVILILAPSEECFPTQAGEEDNTGNSPHIGGQQHGVTTRVSSLLQAGQGYALRHCVFFAMEESVRCSVMNRRVFNFLTRAYFCCVCTDFSFTQKQYHASKLSVRHSVRLQDSP